MDELERKKRLNIFNNKDQNISQVEKCDGVFSNTEMKEFEKLILWLDGAADNPYSHISDDIRDELQKLQQYEYGESEQSNSKLAKENENFAFTNCYNENTESNLSFDPDFTYTQKRNPLHDLPLHYLIAADLYSSETKKYAIVNHSTTACDSEPLYQSLNVVNEKENTKLNIRDYIESFSATLYNENEMENFNTFNVVSNKECRAASDLSNPEVFLNNDICIKESFDDICTENFACSSNSHASSGYSANFGEKHAHSYIEPQKETPSRVIHQGCVNVRNEFINNYETCSSLSDATHVSGTSIISSEAQRHPQEKRFICPLCGEIFPRKDYLVVHCRRHTGERPYACDECGKRFITKGLLSKHRVCHNAEKPFACDICGKRFGRKGDVARHRTSHTGERKYECFSCGKAFADHSNRNRHYKKIHKISKPSKKIS